MKSVTNKNRLVGDCYPAYILAEVGINHNGDVFLAKKMVAAAWESCVNALVIC